MAHGKGSALGARGAPKVLGDFRLRDELGRGGMGLVYRAEQISLGRTVALKVLPQGLGFDDDAVSRFHREAEAAGRLAHPGIVPIYAVGREQGVHFFAMELVEGPSVEALLLSLRDRAAHELLGSLAEETAVADVFPAIGQRTPPCLVPGSRYPWSCAALMAEVAGALDAAHQGQVVHRDLKPSNILIHPSGRPVLVDFGLARDETIPALTRTGDAVGTPAYMAPEQASGQRDLDGRVDIYGFGATLYEMLTLQPPYDGDTSAEIMNRIIEEDPVPVRRLNPRVPADLAGIVHKCLAKDPLRRYQSAAALEADLRAFLDGRPVTARRYAAGRPLMSWLRRRRRAVRVAAAAVLCTALVSAAAGAALLGDRRDRGRDALARARTLALKGSVEQLPGIYGRAAALLGDEFVWRVRRRHLEAGFEALYRQERYDVLERWLGQFPSSLRDPGLERLSARVRGLGRIRVVARPAAAEVRIAAAADDASWRALPEDGVVPIGEYLVKATADGRAPLVRAVRVERDETVEVRAGLPSREGVPDSAAYLPAGDGEPASAIDRTELDAAGYARLLRGLDDTDLRREMLPRGWRDAFPPGDAKHPVVGLSFVQARTAAALLGGHLPSEREFRMAATGGLSERPYPWGTEPAPERLAADPARLTLPLPVHAELGGASPLGVRHLLGNAAEYLAVTGRLPQLAGGHHLTDPAEVTIGLREPVEDPVHAPATAGLRVARFLPPAEAGPQKELWSGRLAERIAGGMPLRLTRWTVAADGEVSLEAVLVGLQARERLSLRTPGFLHRGGASVFWNGRSTSCAERRHEDGEGVDLVPGEEGGWDEREVVVRKALLPLEGGHGVGDAYRLRLPTRVCGGTTGPVELHLPARTCVDRTDPEPSWSWHDRRERVLVWEEPPASGGSIVVRFRVDGALTSRLPAWVSVRALLGRFLDAWGRGSEAPWEELIAGGFRYEPGMLDAEGLRSGEEPRERFAELRLHDLTAIGDVLLADVRADWTAPTRHGEIIDLVDWPLHMHVLRTEQGPRLLRIAVAGRPDGGRVEGGVYQNERLQTEILPPPGGRLRRGHDAPVPMQVDVLPDDGSPWRVEVYGCIAGPDEEPDMVHQRLGAGELVTRPGEMRTGPRRCLVGPPTGNGASHARLRHWLFEDRNGRIRREGWAWLAQGRRYFLVRAVAFGADRQEAEDAYQAAQAWFDAVRAGVRIL